MRIYHNIPALTAYNALNATSNALQKTIQKLSTGLRINSASDDAAGLAISEKMRGQISGLEMAQRNAQDGISMLQTAEGAISSTQSILQRMRELAVQASNDTLTAEDRSYIQLEVGELKNEIERIANTTQFNGKRLLDGSSAGIASSSNLNVKAYVRGSLREIDQFGQKKSFEGNYKIQIKASGAGQGEAQKSSIMVIKHPNVITDVNVNTAAGVEKVSVDKVPAGDYTVETISGDAVNELSGLALNANVIDGAAPSIYSVAGVDDLAFTAMGKRHMKVTITDGANTDGIDIELDENLGSISELADELQDQINTAGTPNTTATVTVSVVEGKIQLTSDKGSITLTETDPAVPELKDIMGTDTPTYSYTMTATAEPTSWDTGTDSHDFTVTYNGTETFRFNIAGQYSTDAETLVTEMNAQLDSIGVDSTLLRAKVVTQGDNKFVQLYSSGAFSIADNDPATVGTVGAIDSIFGAGFSDPTNHDANSLATATGGTFAEDFTFDYMDPAGLTGGKMAMTITYDSDGDGTVDTPQDVIIDWTPGKTANDINDLLANINTQLDGTGIQAQADGKKIKLISTKTFTVANHAEVGTTYDSGYAAILGNPADGTAVQDTTSTDAEKYNQYLKLIGPNNTKSFSIKTDSVAAQDITLDAPIADAKALVTTLNAKFSLAGLNVAASVDENTGLVKLTSNEAITLGAIAGGADDSAELFGSANSVPKEAGMEAVLPFLSATNSKSFSLTTATTGQIDITLDEPLADAAALAAKLNANELADTGIKAEVYADANGNSLIKFVSKETITLGGTDCQELFGIDPTDTDAATSTVTTPAVTSQATLTGSYNLKPEDGKPLSDYLASAVDDITLANNASILFEVTSVNTGNGTLTLKATSNVLTTDGTVKNYVKDNIVLSLTDANALDLGGDLGLAELDDEGNPLENAFTLKLNQLQFDSDGDGTPDTSVFQSGSKFVFNINKALDTTPDARTVKISGTQDPDWPDRWGNNRSDPATGKVTGDYLTENNAGVKFGLDASKTKNKDLHFRNFYVNSANGKVYEGDVVLTTGKDELADNTTLATFTAAYIGKTATGDTKLRDLSAFWNSQGVFMLETPQNITVTQGDGKTTSITIYATDTLNDLRLKLNNAIGEGLGQAQYATGNTDKFCTFVEKEPGKDMPANGLETVAGTFIFRSLVPGAAGRLTFSGDQDIINAFALNVVNEPVESSFTASIYDAHTGQAIATNVKVTDNNLIGVLHPNVDIEFDPMANITAVWSESQSNFITTSENVPYEAVIHLVDSSTVFQVGANKGEDLALDIGDMTAGSLGITKVNVATRESATRAIGQLDAAINKVSAQRAKIGAYQNSLEYTIENLNTTATNLTAAESRIRDADMAKTMMEFVKLQILNQSGTSMLAQANQLPQQVLSLLQ